MTPRLVTPLTDAEREAVAQRNAKRLAALERAVATRWLWLRSPADVLTLHRTRAPWRTTPDGEAA